MSNIFDLYRERNSSSTSAGISNDARPNLPRRLPPAVRGRAVSSTGCSSTPLSPNSTDDSTKGNKTASETPQTSCESAVSGHGEAVSSVRSMGCEFDEGNGIKCTDNQNVSACGHPEKIELSKTTKTKHWIHHPAFHSDELNDVLTSLRPIKVICHSARFENDPPSVVLMDRYPKHCDPMSTNSTIDAKLALQAFAPDVEHVNAIVAERKSKLSKSMMTGRPTTSSEMKFVNGNIDKHTKTTARKNASPSDYVKTLRRMASTDEKPHKRTSQSVEVRAGVLRRRRSAPSSFSPTPYLSSYRDTDEVPRKRRRKVVKEEQFDETMNDLSPGTSQQNVSSSATRMSYSVPCSISGGTSESNGDLEAPINSNNNQFDVDSEDDIIYEAEILSTNEKKLVVKLLNLCRKYVCEVDTKDANWFDQVKMGVVMQANELRRKINQATAIRDELRRKYDRLQFRYNFYKQKQQQQQQQQKRVVRVVAPNVDVGAQQQHCWSSSSTASRGRWIEVPQHIIHNNQFVMGGDTAINDIQMARNSSRMVTDDGVRLQISRGRKPVRIRLTRNRDGVAIPPQHGPTQLYNIAAPKEVVRVPQHPNSSFLSNFIPSR